MTKQTLAAALCLLNIAPGVPAGQAAGRHAGSLTDPAIRYVGRWDKSNSSEYHSHWCAPYLRVGFTGTSVKIKLAESTSLNVSIDGAAPRTIPAGAGETALNPFPLASGRHTLLVGGAGQNEEVRLLGLALDPGASTFAVPARPLIEFIGDSITVVDGAGNYSWLTGEALGCDHTQIAFSGVALTSGYGCVSTVGQDTQYFRLKNYNHAADQPPVPWDFSYTPQVVVINLGQNDQCGDEPAAAMTASYERFLRNLRAKYPQAQIAALRTFGGPYALSIRQAVETLRQGGDTQVHYLDTAGWLGKDDFVDGIHPNGGGNVKVAARLVPLLRPFLSGPASAQVATATVGDPKNPGALPQEILNAYLKGARHIAVRPGTYLCPNSGRTFLTLDGWENAVLDGTGATLILTDLTWTHDCISLNRCDGVTVQGFLLSQTKVIAYQGRVVAVGKGEDGKPYADWRPDAGYPVPPAADKGFLGGDVNIVDAHTRLLKAGNGDFYGAAYEALPNKLFRVHIGGNFGVGDWLVGRYGDAPFKIHLNGSRRCVVKDITLMRNGFAPVREEGGGGNRYLRITWALGPRPGGATENPVVTNAADGMHMTSANPGPDIEDCRFEGVFLDDCIAVHGYLQTVTAASGTSVTIQGNAGDMKVGQPVRISDDKGFFAEGTVTAIQEGKAADGKEAATTLTLDKDYRVPPSAKLSNPRANGAGFKIVGCRLGSTRSRGILVKADNGVIQGNVLEQCGMSAISLGPEYYWGEADYVQNVVIENNTIRDCGQAAYGGAAILVHGDGAVGNKGIVIRDNKMSSNWQGDMDLQWVAGVTVAGNLLTGRVPGSPGAPMYSAITLGNCRDIVLHGNVVQNAAGYKPDWVAIGPAVLNVEHNDPSGIRAANVKAVTLVGPAADGSVKEAGLF